ncbi:MAG: DNA-directed RNA polymerase subunit P [Candidatus Bathyarchaeia archaeon]
MRSGLRSLEALHGDASEGISYVCVNCGAKVTSEELELTPEIKCPFCGYRVLKKTRPPIVKRVKAR